MGPKMSFRYCLMSAELRGVIISLDAVPVLLFVLLDLAAARAHRSSCATSFFHVSQGCVCKAADSVSLMWGWRASFPGNLDVESSCFITHTLHIISPGIKPLSCFDTHVETTALDNHPPCRKARERLSPPVASALTLPPRLLRPLPCLRAGRRHEGCTALSTKP